MSVKKFIIVSNLGFLLPFAIAARFGFYYWAFLIAGVIICSQLFHVARSRNQTYYRLDHFFAWALVITNAAMVFQTNFYNSIYFYLALVSVVLALYFYFNHTKSRKYHAYWHIFSSFITIFSILVSIK